MMAIVEDHLVRMAGTARAYTGGCEIFSWFSKCLVGRPHLGWLTRYGLALRQDSLFPRELLLVFTLRHTSGQTRM